MRIGIDARITYYTHGGISNYALRLIDALAAADAAVEYRILQSRKDRVPIRPAPNFRPVRCWTPAHHRLERWALGAEVVPLRLDLLHSTDFIPPAFGARRNIVTVHDLNFLYFPQFLTAESRRYYNDQIAWAVRRADHVLCDSEATRADLARLLAVPLDRLTTVLLAADERFRPQPVEAVRPVLARYGLEPGYLLFVGTIEPRKNLPALFEAYRQLLDRQLTAAPLVVVGARGWLFDETFARLEALHLEPHVRLIHDAPGADLPALYTAATLFCLPSFYEGFGLPALEAMGCGTPVVAARRGSLVEVVGEAGLLVDPDDPQDVAGALARLLQDADLRARLRQLGLAPAARFSWDRAAQQTLQVYHQVARL